MVSDRRSALGERRYKGRYKTPVQIRVFTQALEADKMAAGRCPQQAYLSFARVKVGNCQDSRKLTKSDFLSLAQRPGTEPLSLVINGHLWFIHNANCRLGVPVASQFVGPNFMEKDGLPGTDLHFLPTMF